MAALGAMYIMGRDVKGKEGVSSPYSELTVASFQDGIVSRFLANQGQGVGGTDKVMNSGDVSAVVSVPKPYKDRLGGAKQNPTKASGKWE